MSTDDFWQDPSTKAWARQVIDSLVPVIEPSEVALALVPSQDGKYSEGDVKMWVEIGAMVMMNKPIIIVVMHNDPVPAKLELVADEIVRLEEGVNPAASDELAEAIRRVAT